MGKRVAREVWEYDTMAEFMADGGAERYGEGQVIIGDSDYRCAGGAIVGSALRSDILKIATIGDSTAVSGDQTTPANNDTSLFSYPAPTSANVPVSKVLAGSAIETLYPAALIVTDCGVGGRAVATLVSDETSASTISTRKAIDCANNDPDVILFRGGSVNDINAANYSTGAIAEATYQTLVDNHKTVLHRLATLGAYVIDSGIYGYNGGLSGYPASTATGDATGDLQRAAIVRFNAEIEAYVKALGNPRIRFINSQGVTSNAGIIFEGYTLLSDGKHLTAVGALAHAAAEKRIIEMIFGTSRKYRYAGKNLQTNPLFAAHTSGLPTGYVATSTTNATGSTHRIERIDDAIWWTREHIVTADGNMYCGFNIPFNPTAAGLNVAIGDVYGVELDFMAENLTTNVLEAITRIRPRMTLYNAANANFIYSDFNLFDGAALTKGSHAGRLMLHLAHTPIKFQNAAADWGTSSVLGLNFGAVAKAGEIIKIGISNPRIVKLA